MSISNVYPVAAIVGQEELKTALIVNLINPMIGGVLIAGEKGTAKSTLARGLADLTELPVVNVPLNITEDRLVGSLDMETAIREGQRRLDEGLLSRANGGIVYVDEVNLLSDHIVDILLEVSSRKENIIEREGISQIHDANFVLIGSMNPEEGKLRPSFVDRFGLYVEVHSEDDPDKRCEIMRRRLEYETDARAFNDSWREESEKLADVIRQAKNRTDSVRVEKEHLDMISNLAREGRCAGHRAEIVTLETAIALAALDGATTLTREHILKAAKFALPHRILESVSLEDYRMPESDPPDGPDKGESDHPGESQLETTDTQLGNNGIAQDQTDQWEDIDRESEEITLRFAEKAKAGGYGKRLKLRESKRYGRYIKYRIPSGKVSDLAVDATIRSAILRGRSQSEAGLAVNIKDIDIREKVREHRCGTLICFVVDASGSMGAQKRMGAVKGAILSLLNEAYEKRDSVSLIAFKGEEAKTILSPTRSPDLAYKRLREIKTGGKTPLAHGLMQAYLLLKTERVKQPDSVQILVLVSDGKSNVCLHSDNANDDALYIAEKIKFDGVKSIVIDTQSGLIHYPFAETIAKNLNGKYINLKYVGSKEILDILTN